VRELSEHRVNPVNDRLAISVVDAPGAGGANHVYQIAEVVEKDGYAVHEELAAIVFQNGPINTAGVNGVTHEALLAIVADRLRSFQAGPYACKENACALTHIEEAMHWPHSRTLKRMQRGVEGTHAL